MISEKPRKAFILGAGFGSRMRPLTNNCPKPMLEIAGRSIIWRILDKLRAAGVREAIVNTHYLAKNMKAHMADYVAQHRDMSIEISHESQILDTGGGVKKALKYFGSEPFYVIAGDSLWEDGDVPALDVLAQAWDFQKMDFLTLLKPIQTMSLTKGVGDFHLLDDGKIWRSHDKKGDYMWTNIRINSPRIYQGIKDKAFSFLPILDDLEEKGRAYALRHEAEWHHISTPEDYEAVNEHFKKLEKKVS